MRDFFHKFRWFIKYYKKNYIIGLFFLGLTYFLVILPPQILGTTTDAIVSGNITQPVLTRNILLIVGIAAVYYLTSYIWGLKIFQAADEISRLTRMRLFNRVLKQGPIFFSKYSTGALMGKATNDVEAISDLASYGTMALFDASVYPALLLIMMLAISWRITLLSLLPYPFLVFFAKKIGEKLYIFYDEAQTAFDQMNEFVLEGVSGVRLVRAYSLEERETKRFQEKTDELFQKNIRTSRFSQLYRPMTTLIPTLAFVLAMGGGIFEIRAGRLTTGNLLSFSFYLNMLSWPMIAIGEFLIHAQQGASAMDRVDEVLDEPLDVVDPPNPLDYPENTSLKVENLSFQYPAAAQDSYALQDISFELGSGQSLGLVGPVGSGKTSLLRQFLHFYPLAPKQIFVGGQDLALIDRQQLKQRLSYVPQQFFLFSQTIRENILLGATDEDLATGQAEVRLQEVLEIADLAKDLDQFIDGLDTETGEKGIALSGGQKQRISIARALMKDAEILILDDCLSAVDALTEDHILRGLGRDRAGKVTLIAAHRLSAVKDCDLILVLDQGRIVERGTHQELLAAGRWYAEQFIKQQLEQRIHI
ncbi:MAG: ABC transporter ATP-binding protein [Eubacteriales bacterium]|nr:ABC transporter ATP-binding protein [Eubacteriales bacterium]